MDHSKMDRKVAAVEACLENSRTELDMAEMTLEEVREEDDASLTELSLAIGEANDAEDLVSGLEEAVVLLRLAERRALTAAIVDRAVDEIMELSAESNAVMFLKEHLYGQPWTVEAADDPAWEEAADAAWKAVGEALHDRTLNTTYKY